MDVLSPRPCTSHLLPGLPFLPRQPLALLTSRPSAAPSYSFPLQVLSGGLGAALDCSLHAGEMALEDSSAQGAAVTAPTTQWGDGWADFVPGDQLVKELLFSRLSQIQLFATP